MVLEFKVTNTRDFVVLDFGIPFNRTEQRTTCVQLVEYENVYAPQCNSCFIYFMESSYPLPKKKNLFYNVKLIIRLQIRKLLPILPRCRQNSGAR